MPTYAELSAQNGPAEAARLYRAETEARRARERAATAEIRSRMLALGIAEDAALIAAGLIQTYPQLEDHGVSSLWERPIEQERVRAALKAYAAALALSEAA